MALESVLSKRNAVSDIHLTHRCTIRMFLSGSLYMQILSRSEPMLLLSQSLFIQHECTHLFKICVITMRAHNHRCMVRQCFDSNIRPVYIDGYQNSFYRLNIQMN